MTSRGTYSHQTPGGRLVMTCLDWSGRDGVRHWGGGELGSCRSCEQPTLLVDNGGRPQHKACAERETDLALAKTAAVRQRTREDTRPAEAKTERRITEPEGVPAEPEAELLW